LYFLGRGSALRQAKLQNTRQREAQREKANQTKQYIDQLTKEIMSETNSRKIPLYD
jgi:hypothetical protein